MISRFDSLPNDIRDIIYHKLHNICLQNVNLEYKRKINNIKYKILIENWGERIKCNSNSQIHYLLENIDYFDILNNNQTTGPKIFH
tara:strand:- start:130 stop:387 length:258 start_codon:yes stop_codon:yes gene_type:complete